MKKTKISPRKAPKQSRSRVLVDTIVTATTRVLTRSGYEEATTNRVAEMAGVSIGSLYQYFPNKDALIAAVLDRIVESNTRKIERRLKAIEDLPLEEALRIVVKTAYDIYLGNRALFSVLFEQAPRLHRVQHIFRARRLVGERLASMLEKYGIVPRNRKLAMFILMNSVLGVIQTAIFDFPEDAEEEEIIENLVALALAYLKVISGSKNP